MLWLGKDVRNQTAERGSTSDRAAGKGRGGGVGGHLLPGGSPSVYQSHHPGRGNSRDFGSNGTGEPDKLEHFWAFTCLLTSLVLPGLVHSCSQQTWPGLSLREALAGNGGSAQGEARGPQSLPPAPSTSRSIRHLLKCDSAHFGVNKTMHKIFQHVPQCVCVCI